MEVARGVALPARQIAARLTAIPPPKKIVARISAVKLPCANGLDRFASKSSSPLQFVNALIYTPLLFLAEPL